MDCARYRIGSRAVPAFTSPEMSEIREASRVRMEDLTHTFIDLDRRALGIIEQWSIGTASLAGAEELSSFAHPLSDALEWMNPVGLPDAKRCAGDLSLFEAADLNVRALPSERIPGLMAAMRGEHCGYRSLEVGTQPDGFGNFLIYPEKRLIRSQLAELDRFVGANAAERPVLCAIACYVALLTIHPYADGNGRIARACASAQFSSLLGKRIFLPLRKIDQCTRGALLLYVRQVQLRRDWESLIDFLAGTLELLTVASKSAA